MNPDSRPRSFPGGVVIAFFKGKNDSAQSHDHENHRKQGQQRFRPDITDQYRFGRIVRVNEADRFFPGRILLDHCGFSGISAGGAADEFVFSRAKGLPLKDIFKDNIHTVSGSVIVIMCFDPAGLDNTGGLDPVVRSQIFHQLREDQEISETGTGQKKDQEKPGQKKFSGFCPGGFFRKGIGLRFFPGIGPGRVNNAAADNHKNQRKQNNQARPEAALD